MCDSKGLTGLAKSPTSSIAGLQILSQALRLGSGNRADILGDAGEVGGDGGGVDTQASYCPAGLSTGGVTHKLLRLSRRGRSPSDPRPQR